MGLFLWESSLVTIVIVFTAGSAEGAEDLSLGVSRCRVGWSRRGR